MFFSLYKFFVSLKINTFLSGDIKKISLKDQLPKTEQKTVEAELKWHYMLEKHSLDDQNKTKKTKKRKFLTRQERKQLNLLKLPKQGWSYSALEGMRRMWREYMRENLEGDKVPTCQNQEWAAFSVTLAKSELIGAEITVVRSKNTNLVNKTGTVVLETKETFQIVTPKSELKVLVKKDSVFSFDLDGNRFTFFGKHLATRPAERSTKKVKSFMQPDL